MKRFEIEARVFRRFKAFAANFAATYRRFSKSNDTDMNPIPTAALLAAINLCTLPGAA